MKKTIIHVITVAVVGIVALAVNVGLFALLCCIIKKIFF